MGVRNDKIRKQLQLLRTRHVNELNAFRQRITSGKDEQRKNRSLELERYHFIN